MDFLKLDTARRQSETIPGWADMDAPARLIAQIPIFNRYLRDVSPGWEIRHPGGYDPDPKGRILLVKPGGEFPIIARAIQTPGPEEWEENLHNTLWRIDPIYLPRLPRREMEYFKMSLRDTLHCPWDRNTPENSGGPIVVSWYTQPLSSNYDAWSDRKAKLEWDIERATGTGRGSASHAQLIQSVSRQPDTWIKRLRIDHQFDEISTDVLCYLVQTEKDGECFALPDTRSTTGFSFIARPTKDAPGDSLAARLAKVYGRGGWVWDSAPPRLVESLERAVYDAEII